MQSTASHCGGCSCRGARILEFEASAAGTWALERGLWSMGSVVAVRGLSPATCGISVPQPGIELASPALEDRFLNTEPPV